MTQTILPPEPAKAVKHVIGIVEQLIKLMERESMALAKGDGVSFSAAQSEKAALSASYEQASVEFRTRLMDFRNVDRALLDKLDRLQRDLSARSQENMAAMERMSG